MSSDERLVLPRIPRGSGWALDLGGGSGMLRPALEDRGYDYVNLDPRPGGGGRIVVGDGHRLPFADGTFSLVVAKESLYCLADPLAGLGEIHRVLHREGRFVAYTPFLHPRSGDEYLRLTPLGLELMLRAAGFRMAALESPTWLFTVLAQVGVAALHRVGLGALEPGVERTALRLDRRFRPRWGTGQGFTDAYLVVATPDGPPPTSDLVAASHDGTDHKSPWQDRLTALGVRLGAPGSELIP